MPQEYQMHFVRDDGELGLTLFFAAETDGAAIVQATSELEVHASFLAVEVRQDAHLVGRIARPAAPSGSA